MITARCRIEGFLDVEENKQNKNCTEELDVLIDTNSIYFRSEVNGYVSVAE